MRYIFLFSGENQKLAAGELKAILQAYNLNSAILERAANIAICELKGEFDLRILQRLALTKAVYKFLGECEAEEEKILKFFKNIDLKGEFSGKANSFCVRVKKLSKADFLSVELQAKIGKIIKERTQAKVELTFPELLFQCFYTGNKFIASLLLKEIKHKFAEREPNKRPRFHPSTMKPKLARAIVNLTGVKEGERFLDPFCGVGGLLIEAGLIGAEVYGVDKDFKMVEACRENLSFYKIRAEIEHGDAREIGMKYSNFFHAVACDPPYGRSSSTLGERAEKLYRESLKSIYEALIEKRHACVLAPKSMSIEEYAEEAGFKIAETFDWRVHKSLVRRIYLLQKY